MRLAGLERDAQRLAGAEQVFLADDLVDSARTQTLGKRNIGTVFFEHGALEGFRISLGKTWIVRSKSQDSDNRALFETDAVTASKSMFRLDETQIEP